MVKKTIIIFILFLLFGCKSKIRTVETHSTDTIYKSEIIKITPSQLNQLIIDNPCDSLGALKHFEYIIMSNKNKSVLKSSNNKLLLDINIDSTKSVTSTEKKITIKSSSEILKIPYTPKWFWFLLIYTILLTIYTIRRLII
jgi:hypothetical protein